VNVYDQNGHGLVWPGRENRYRHGASLSISWPVGYCSLPCLFCRACADQPAFNRLCCVAVLTICGFAIAATAYELLLA